MDFFRKVFLEEEIFGFILKNEQELDEKVEGWVLQVEYRVFGKVVIEVFGLFRCYKKLGGYRGRRMVVDAVGVVGGCQVLKVFVCQIEEFNF